MMNMMKNCIKYGIYVFVGMFLISVFFHPVYSLKNPSAVYCSALGYTYTIEKAKDGGDIGYCTLPNGEKIDSWRFLQGRDRVNFSYCTKQGFEQKIVNDPTVCLQFLTQSCAVCILKNGTEVEVTKLMNLSFAETTCGDSNCGFPENYYTCPKDCPSGALDEYCDGVLDDKCDSDCIKMFGADLDCPVALGIPLIHSIILGVSIVALIGVGYVILKKKKK